MMTGTPNFGHMHCNRYCNRYATDMQQILLGAHKRWLFVKEFLLLVKRRSWEVFEKQNEMQLQTVRSEDRLCDLWRVPVTGIFCRHTKCCHRSPFMYFVFFYMCIIHRLCGGENDKKVIVKIWFHPRWSAGFIMRVNKYLSCAKCDRNTSLRAAKLTVIGHICQISPIVD